MLAPSSSTEFESEILLTGNLDSGKKQHALARDTDGRFVRSTAICHMCWSAGQLNRQAALGGCHGPMSRWLLSRLVRCRSEHLTTDRINEMEAGAGQARYRFISRACFDCFLGKQGLYFAARPRATEQDGTPSLTVSHSTLQEGGSRRPLPVKPIQSRTIAEHDAA